MQGVPGGLVDIVRDFLSAHKRLRALFGAFRDGSLEFSEVRDLVDDSADSPLFRLKERCHQLFREGDAEDETQVRREALFDLAVGSLFHEAMKFRENLYQREVYGPKVESLRQKAGGEGGELLREFAKILDATGTRLLEAAEESEALLALTRQQFRVLLFDHRGEGLVARTLFDYRALVEAEFDEGLDELLDQVYGTAADGFWMAALSYLHSAHFAEALEVIEEARKRPGRREDWDRIGAYAAGMQGFLAGRYGESLSRLRDWADGLPPDLSQQDPERTFAKLAHAAWSRADELLAERNLGELRPEAADLVARLAALND